MTLNEILRLPLINTYKLQDSPEDLEDLFELCDEFLDYRDEPELGYVMFPVGEGWPDPTDICEGEPVVHQPYDAIKLLQESPIVFSVEESNAIFNVVDYGVVQGAELRVYRQEKPIDA